MASSTSNIQPDDEVLIEMYRRMLLIRKSEEQLFRDVKLGRTPGQVHLVRRPGGGGRRDSASNLDDRDQITSTHRGHGHYLAKGGDVNAMFAEVYGKAEGICRGMGGSMHVADFSNRDRGCQRDRGGRSWHCHRCRVSPTSLREKAVPLSASLVTEQPTRGR